MIEHENYLIPTLSPIMPSYARKCAEGEVFISVCFCVGGAVSGVIQQVLDDIDDDDEERERETASTADDC